MNLLYDQLIRTRTNHGLQAMSLPELLAALGRDEINGYVGIQRHQEEAFHVFLCYLSGAILARCNQSEPIQDEEFWRDGMKQLAGGVEEAWKLIVGNHSLPAFMQPPLPRDDAAKLSVYATTPDELDLLPTAKNHDVKKARAARPHVDEWIYALVSLQTMSGFFGRGNQGISRMNGGFGSRLIVELARATSLGGRWHDAVLRLQEHREDVLDKEFGYDSQGLVLVWLEPWDGSTSLPLSKLDPFFIEICRRIRLKGNESTITGAEAVPAESVRIDAKTLKGVLGDAWAPISVSTSKSKEPDIKALTISTEGITAEVLRNLIFDQSIIKTALHKPLDSWKGQLWLIASVFVRGQGTTDGFYDRKVLIPEKTRPRLWSSPEQLQELAEVSKMAVDYAGIMKFRVLKPAVFVYLEGAPETISMDRKSVQAWWEHLSRRYEDRWSADLFPWLWSLPEPFDRQEVLNKWVLLLRDHAHKVLDQAVQTMPAHTNRRYYSYSRAQRAFWGALYNQNNFPTLKEELNERVSGS